ncbi:MAG: hypothetical protein JWM18_4771, partial [Chloroflexi bacterium]|nr:hypothetical protein [Chloroflexota bacterium]
MSVTPATEAAGQRAADLAVTCLLNCFLREAGPATELAGGRLRVRLAHLGIDLEMGLRHRSATGHHLFDLPVRALAAPAVPAVALDPGALAALLGRELAAGDPRAD